MTAVRKRRRVGGLRKRCEHRPEQWPKCPHAWHLNFQHRGVHHRISLDRHLGKHIEAKTDAEEAAADIKKAIRAGKFGERLPARDVLTVEQLLSTYITEYVTPERPRSLTNAKYQAGAICRYELTLPTGERRRFGSWLVVDVSTGALEKYRAASRVQRVVESKDKDGKQRRRRIGGVLTTNRNLAFLRAAFNWAVRLDYLPSTPFKGRDGNSSVKLSKELSRRRRLEGDESEHLLAACRPQLRPLVEAALETGCRKGELLSLQWWQVRGLQGTRPELNLPASKTKTTRDRVVPISTRLKAILEMRRNDPNGEPHGPQAYVFGNEIGQRTRSIKTAWRAACRRAGIHDLHFHDLRREAGSRWLDGGVPLQTVRDWLGHSNISQTSTYLESTLKGQHDAMKKFDEQRAVQGRANAGGNQGDPVTPADTDAERKAQENIH